MNTALAAAQAKVTVATIRTWCRRGVITATKAAGRWVIDTASLAHRIAIGAMKTTVRKTVEVTVETMVAIGGRRWQKAGHDRVYLNGWTRFLPLEVGQYKSGSISWAAWEGEKISNSQAYKLLDCIDKVWFDAADGKLHTRAGYSESRVADRAEVAELIATGIRREIAAL